VACFFIATTWSESGLTNDFRVLSQELIRRGHTVVILTNRQAAEAATNDAHLTVYGWPSQRPTQPRDFLFLYRLVGRYRPDCIIANFGAVNVCTIVGWLMRVPQRLVWYRTLLSQLKADSAHPAWKFRLLVLRKLLIYRLATWVVANSETSLADVQREYFVPSRRSRYVYNFIPDPVSIRTAEQSQARSGILCVARLDTSKGQDILVRALPRLIEEFPDISIEFIGKGPRQAELIELARELNVLEHCVFRGALPYAEVLKRMNCALFTVAPVRSEAFGRVIVEAMASGTPVVASKVDAIPEIIRDGVDGWLTPPEDPAALADRMAQLLRDPARREMMGANARRRFLSDFEQSVNRDRFVTWLEAQLK
jgi:glycosyltransferase involved in cell wall biosynthesis